MSQEVETFVCDMCSRVCEKGPDEEALEEMRQNFGDIPEDERQIVCDDCYEYVTTGKNDLMEHFNKCHNPYSPKSEYVCDIEDCWWRLHAEEQK